MGKASDDNIFSEIQLNIDWIIDNVIKRGYDDIEEDYDDYSLLLQTFEFKNLVIFELYENYFTPKRHEFELQIVKEIVEAVTKYSSLGFSIEIALAGVIGNTAFTVLIKLLKHVTLKFKNKDNKRTEIFLNIKIHVEKLNEYFKEHECATINELESLLNTDREKIVPLLKLGGFKCYRRKKGNIWARPN
ncbi:UNVERIFIED_CONTAM: hypothetical protein Cloal_0721 [Acetivibrio alkalicellulosi]